MSKSNLDVKTIFDQALEIEDPHARETWVNNACAKEPGLRRQVNSLLQAFNAAGNFLQEPITATVDNDAAESKDVVPFEIESQPRSLGRFQIQHELGRGGSGVVFKAYDPDLKRNVALKIPRGESLASSDTRQRFLREAEAAAGLDHPNLVPVYEVGDVAGVCFIASAYCSGPDLAKWLVSTSDPVTPRIAATLVAILAGAIEHAHSRGVLHRDLKPSNILLFSESIAGKHVGWEDLPFTPRVADFGLAKLVESSWEQTRTSVILGTPLYMAPEQAAGHLSESQPHADIYSLGAILYQLLTGRTPFEGPTLLSVLDRVRNDEPITPRHHRPNIPRDLETICLKCLQKDPRDRFATAEKLATDLGSFLAGEAIQARPLAFLDRYRIWSRRPERIHDAGVMAIVVGVVFAIWIVFGFSGVIAKGIIGQVSSQLATHSTLVVVGQLIPMIWIGTQTLKKKLIAIWCGLILSASTMIANSLPLFGSVTAFSEIYDPNPYAKWMVYFLLTVLFAVQTLVFATALRAYYAVTRLAGPQVSA